MWPPFTASTACTLLYMCLVWDLISSTDILSQASWTAVLSSPMLVGNWGWSQIMVLSLFQSGLIGLRLGEEAGWGKSSIEFWASQAFILFAVWDLALSCWKRTSLFPHSFPLGGVGHCFAWHVRVSLGFYLNFTTDKLVHSGLCATWHLGYNSIFTFARIKILVWRINK